MKKKCWTPKQWDVYKYIMTLSYDITSDRECVIEINIQEVRVSILNDATIINSHFACGIGPLQFEINSFILQDTNNFLQGLIGSIWEVPFQSLQTQHAMTELSKTISITART